MSANPNPVRRYKHEKETDRMLRREAKLARKVARAAARQDPEPQEDN